MVNRTGTYFAFDGLGEADPTKSDFKYYAIAQRWDTLKNIDFDFVDSHEKASAVRDTSKRATLEASILKRLAASKNMVVIISDKTRQSGSMLDFEIIKAVDTYDLPLIIAYTDYSFILDVEFHENEWPTSLKTRIINNTAKAIHVPFKKDAILDAINRFTVNTNKLNISNHNYSWKAHEKWGYL